MSCVVRDTHDVVLRKNHQTCELQRDPPVLGRISDGKGLRANELFA
jgi:hypothetical protein